MKITVITVCRNAEDTIEGTLQSVRSQRYPNVEHLVIDGGSKDGTLDVVKRHRDRIAKCISEPDRGIYDAMNKGIGLATGDVIGFLNADDLYAHGDVLSRVADAITNSHVDALFGDAEFFDSNDPQRVIRRYRSRRFRPDRIGWGWMPAHPTLFLKRQVFERYGSFRIDYRIAGDFELVARIFHDNTLRYRYLPEIMVRMRAGGISTEGWRSTLLLNKEVLRACKENGIPTNILKILSKYPAKVVEFLHK